MSAHRNSKAELKAGLAIAFAGVLVFGSVGPASAEEPSPEISDATEIVSEVAPEILAQTSDALDVAVTDSLAVEEVVVSVDALEQSEAGASTIGVTFSIDYATST